MIKRIFIAGCLCTASFFVGCQQQEQNAKTEETSSEKESEMYEASELALLMRGMYEDNLAIGQRIEKGEIPESFPEDFYNIHTAPATPGMMHDTAFFKTMASQYIANMEKITKAKDPKEAKVAYNEMIMTCASCHQVYCQGPLAKIKRMKLPINE